VYVLTSNHPAAGDKPSWSLSDTAGILELASPHGPTLMIGLTPRETVAGVAYLRDLATAATALAEKLLEGQPQLPAQRIRLTSLTDVALRERIANGAHVLYVQRGREDFELGRLRPGPAPEGMVRVLFDGEAESKATPVEGLWLLAAHQVGAGGVES